MWRSICNGPYELSIEAKSEGAVETVKVSPKFQIVIPKTVRESLGLQPGQELRIYAVNGSIRATVPRSIKELRGMAKGLKWKDEDRDRNDRF
jgi:AbrB family looped-hinge helix DNA binding protein